MNIISCILQAMATAHGNFTLQDFQQTKDAFTWAASGYNSQNMLEKSDVREKAFQSAMAGFSKLCLCANKFFQLTFKVKIYGALIRIGVHTDMSTPRDKVVFQVFYEYVIWSLDDVQEMERKLECLFKVFSDVNALD